MKKKTMSILSKKGGLTKTYKKYSNDIVSDLLQKHKKDGTVDLFIKENLKKQN